MLDIFLMMGLLIKTTFISSGIQLSFGCKKDTECNKNFERT